MGMKFRLALTSMVWLAVAPWVNAATSLPNAAQNHASAAPAPVVAQPWFDGQAGQAARLELETQLHEAALAALHPTFKVLWRQLQASAPSARGPLYDEAFAKLMRLRQHWLAMDFVSRQQLATRRLDLTPAANLVPATSGSLLLAQVRVMAPQMAEYSAVRGRVAELLALAPTQWPELALPTLRPGERAAQLPALRSRLALLGADISGVAAASEQYDDASVAAVQAFQRQHGLAADGVIGRQTLTMLNASPLTRASLLLRSLWRRDVVDLLNLPRYLLVNLPDYRLSVVEQGQEVFISRTIVGQRQRATPFLASEIRSVVVNPAWHVPRSILQQDILPKIAKDPSYLARENFEVIDRDNNVVLINDADWPALMAAGFPYRLRQKPGDDNALGRYKFYLPNNDAIYLHATPGQSLFARGARAFSSGCIRVEQAAELADFLLTGSQYWPAKVKGLLAEGQTKWLPLIKPMPLFTVYWSSWLDSHGRQHLRPDIYGVDAISFAPARLL
ncbi:MAG: L,D-transpeptidase family protein [Aeromonas sp.]